MTVVPFPTAARRRKDERLRELFEDAKAQVAAGDKPAAWLSVLASIEVAYGLGSMPEELAGLLDQLNACRDYLR